MSFFSFLTPEPKNAFNPEGCESAVAVPSGFGFGKAIIVVPVSVSLPRDMLIID